MNREIENYTQDTWMRVDNREIHECDGRVYDPDTMVAPLTPKPTRKTETEFISYVYCRNVYVFEYRFR